MWIIIVSPLVLGFVSAVSTRKEVASLWYRSLKKPWFNPPRYVFAPVWTILYLAVGVCLNFVFNLPPDHADHTLIHTALSACILQLGLNYVWSYLFFVKKDIVLAVTDILLIWTLSLVTLVCFFLLGSLIGLLFFPYFVWVTYASAITVSVYHLNEDFQNPVKNCLVPPTN